ncbi:metallophosphoesterase [Paenibacillus popilliae]|uniref:Metallophosphoesterase n=1 Tax=Paenibacillus popilliae TaxID=78057 RepID=A0ABY3ARM9_PAEPP|nr:metallophosphoesterase [Paenibacillus sp. SDF0028]TQR44505.1 metallophosphoesterase [Paenibacillus sp. SDF0028]
MKDKKWSKHTIRVSLIVLLLLAGTLFYGMKMEPNSLSVTRQMILNRYIPPSFHGMKIVHFSDVHLGDHFNDVQLLELVDRINQEHPDIIVFTGDMVDNFNAYGNRRDRSQRILGQLQATLGKYAVFGNHDRGGGGSRIYQTYMEEAGFTVLVNDTKQIHLPNHDEYITISGLDDFLLGAPNIHGTLKDLEPDNFNLLVVHEPDVADQVIDYPIDLQLSGHSHGGQVQLPWYGTIYTPPLAKKYVEGMYKIEGTTTLNKPMKLFVNRGIGTTELPVRFLSKPEITVHTLMRS